MDPDITQTNDIRLVELKPDAVAAAAGGEQAERAESAVGGTVVNLTPLLLNYDQVRRILGDMSERHIRALVSSGRFPKPVDRKYVGRVTRWKRSDVEKWAERLP